MVACLTSKQVVVMDIVVGEAAFRPEKNEKKVNEIVKIISKKYEIQSPIYGWKFL